MYRPITMMKTHFHFRAFAQKALYIFTIIASLILIADITIVDLPNIQKNLDVEPSQLQFWICIYFLIDFILLVLIADNKWQHFKRYFFLLPLSIPYSDILSFYSIDINQNLVYLLKFLPIIRGVVALILLINLLITNRITGLFIAYLSIFISIAYIQTLIFFLFESPKNPEVESYYDVLWWASMTVTTLGSNIIPITSVGKVCTAILAITGITIFPIFTVYITTMVQAWNSGKDRRVNEAHHTQSPQKQAITQTETPHSPKS